MLENGVNKEILKQRLNAEALTRKTLSFYRYVSIENPSVKAAIKNNNTSEIYMMINQGGAQGMITMEQDLKRLYLAKKISLETAITYANNKTRIQQILAA